jgi:hypothetical protein
VLRSIRQIQEQLRRLARRLPRWGVEEEFSKGMPERRAAWLAGGDHLGAGGEEAAVGQPIPERFELGGLATAVDAFEHDEPTAMAHRMESTTMAHPLPGAWR